MVGLMDDSDPFDELDLEDGLKVDLLMGWDGPTCAACGAPLGGDPDEEPTGQADLPICGECRRGSR
jgi:hypothetical protein